jgi:hypothetical protein
VERVSTYSKVIIARIIQSVFYIRVGDKKPMADELQLCPTCQRDYVRPTGKVHGMDKDTPKSDTHFVCN